MWLETTVRNRYIGQSYWDTHYSAKSCNGAEKYSTLGWKRKNKNNMLNTLAIKRDFFTYHICVTLGSVKRLNLACTQPNPFNYCETHKTVNTRKIYGMLTCVARNNPIRHEITKPQTAKVISLWFWGLLVYPELYCDWPVHNQQSWNFSGVHGFLSFTVNTWRDGCLKSSMANWGRPINQRKKSGTHENFDLVSNIKLLCAKPTA